MRTYEERLAQRAARRAMRMAAMENTARFNDEMRTTLHENWLENRQAFHEDCIRNQAFRQQLTEIFFPGIAASATYQNYVSHNIDRHDLHIKKLDADLNGDVFSR